MEMLNDSQSSSASRQHEDCLLNDSQSSSARSRQHEDCSSPEPMPGTSRKRQWASERWVEGKKPTTARVAVVRPNKVNNMDYEIYIGIREILYDHSNPKLKDWQFTKNVASYLRICGVVTTDDIIFDSLHNSIFLKLLSVFRCRPLYVNLFFENIIWYFQNNSTNLFENLDQVESYLRRNLDLI